MALFVASIDFGTTYSGWAYSSKGEFESEPTKIFAKQWQGGSLMSMKVPTTVLIEPNGRTLHAFGFKAEDKYIELAAENQHEKWYYYKRFKMLLFKQIGIKRDIKLKDETGKELSAKKVFSLAIKYLRDDVISTIAMGLIGDAVTDKDLHWVLTVPAIWNDAAKQFMREAAEEAKIPSDRLSIALEPEAASLFCRSLPVEKSRCQDKTSLASFKAGRKYMVLDAGGGTVDITVHEVTVDGNLKELHKASGGDWGGTKVDLAFEYFIDAITGKGVMKAFRQIHMEDYMDFCREFEIKKRTISPKNTTKTNIKIPATLKDITKMITGKPFEETVANSQYKDKVGVFTDKLRVNTDVSLSLFDRPVQHIVLHVESLLQEPAVAGCDTILMVGGFSESPVLQEAIKNYFTAMKILIPEEAGIVVVKGAVIFGHAPKAISERVCKMTYGTNVAHTYDSKTCEHPVGRRTPNKAGVMICHDLFEIHIRAGESVELGKEQLEVVSTPVDKDQDGISWTIYVSSNRNPKLVTEPNCNRIGCLTVPIHDTSMGLNRRFGASFIFGGTEIEVKVVDKAISKTYKTRVNFLG